MSKGKKRHVIVDPAGRLVPGTDQANAPRSWAAMFRFLLSAEQLVHLVKTMKAMGWRCVEIRILEAER